MINLRMYRSPVNVVFHTFSCVPGLQQRMWVEQPGERERETQEREKENGNHVLVSRINTVILLPSKLYLE